MLGEDTLLVLLIIGIVLLVIAAVRYWQQRMLHWVTIVAGVVLAILGGLGMHAAANGHFGRTVVPVSKVQTIKPAATIEGFNIVESNNAKSSAAVYTYMRNGKTYQTVTSKNKTQLQKTDDKAALKTSMTTYQKTNVGQQFLLMGLPKLVKGDITSTVMVPKSWYVIDNSDLKKIQAYEQAQVKTIPAKVKEKMPSAMTDAAKKDKSILTDKNKQEALQKTVINDVTKQVHADAQKAIAQQLKDANQLK